MPGGNKISSAEFYKLHDDIAKNPQDFIVQRFMPLSQVDGHIVDLRLHTLLEPGKTILSQSFWGRGTLAEGSNGKVNISGSGKEFVVLTKADAEEVPLCPIEPASLVPNVFENLSPAFLPPSTH